VEPLVSKTKYEQARGPALCLFGAGMMWNKQKTLGVLIAAGGVFLGRIDVFFSFEKTLLLSLNALGILIAFLGIAVYAGGMPRQLKKSKGCPFCFTKNDAASAACRRCRKPL